MTAESDLAKLAALHGILPEYTNMQGEVRTTGPEAQRALLAALGVAVETEALVRESFAEDDARQKERATPEEVIIPSHEPVTLPYGAGFEWELSDTHNGKGMAYGHASDVVSLPPLASGIYALHLRQQDRVETVRILAAPRRLPSVESLTGAQKVWGVNLALYGLRSERNRGVGDYQDLNDMAAISGEFGASFVGVNPIHSMGYADASFSPYSPSHRAFLNTDHIALDQIPVLQSAPRMAKILADENVQIASLRAADSVPYQNHKALLQRALNAAFLVFLEDADAKHRAQFKTFAETTGPELKTFAAYEVTSETRGPDWRNWTSAHLAAPDPRRMEFHVWLQWLADTQLKSAQETARSSGLSLGLYLDLAVGPRRGGAESWCEQDCIANDVSIGAPPDHLSPEGQNWDLAAFAPRKLQKANYRPLRHILSRTMRHAGVIRIDHVLGLARSFLIPDSGAPGAYIAQPLEALIAVIKIEAELNNCAVIGEDLGLVPETFRETMRGHGFYGYSVLQYEDLDAEPGPDGGHAQVLSCFATHDTPTVDGFEAGRDISWWHKLGWIGDDDVADARAKREADVRKIFALGKPATDFQTAVLAIMAQSPACMISIQLDDILRSSEAQNLPGTIDQHPNWRRKYSLHLEDLRTLKSFKETAAIMAPTRSVQKEDA